MKPDYRTRHFLKLSLIEPGPYLTAAERKKISNARYVIQGKAATEQLLKKYNHQPK